MSGLREVLVVVHPGSACGSADFNLGKDVADACRARLVADLDAWTGPVAVLDGALSEELDDRRFLALSRAIQAVHDRAGDKAASVWACDEEGLTEEGAAMVVEALGLAPADHAVALTGAWYDPEQGFGCVNSVIESFEALGFEVRVLPGAVSDTRPDWSAEAATPSP